MNAPCLITHRLCLHPVVEADVDALHSLWTLPGVRRYLFDDRVLSREESVQYVRAGLNAFAEHGLGPWKVLRAGQRDPIGFCGLRRAPRGVEMVYALRDDCLGAGYATEAVEGMLSWAFSRGGVERVVADTDPPNAPSIRVLQRLGFRACGQSKVGELDLLHFGATKEDFAARLPDGRLRSVIETPRLALRQMSLADLPFVASMLADAETMRFYPKVYATQEARTWVERQEGRYLKYGHGLWLALDRATGEPVGQVGVTVQTVDGVEEPEIGYIIHKSFWRRGLATEAALACRNWVFQTLQRDYIISLVRPENLPSQGVARKMGMREWKRALHAGMEHIVFRVERDS